MEKKKEKETKKQASAKTPEQEARPYHHGNLKQVFIERGLEYIDKYGVESLSMRKLAESIGVSCAAYYAHFKNKDAFLAAVSEYITDSLAAALQETMATCEDRSRILLAMGKRYVLFFYENPLYYQFLFTRGNIDLGSNAPFQMFREVAEQSISAMHGTKMSKAVLEKKTLAMWSMVHGLAQLSQVDGVLDKSKLDQDIESILCAVEV